MNIWFFVYVSSILILSGLGNFCQKGLGYEKYCQDEDEKHNTLLPTHCDNPSTVTINFVPQAT
jgi:hypothetical protein